jgi:hypothetical protein
VSNQCFSEQHQNFSAFAETLRQALESGKSKSSAIQETISPTLSQKIEAEATSGNSEKTSRTLSIPKRSLPSDVNSSTQAKPKKVKAELLSKREKAKKRKEEKRTKESTPNKAIIETLQIYLKAAHKKNLELESQLALLQQSQDFIEGGKRHSEIKEILRKSIVEAKEKTRENEKLKDENTRLRKIVENLTFKLHGTTGDNIYYGGHYSEADS